MVKLACYKSFVFEEIYRDGILIKSPTQTGMAIYDPVVSKKKKYK